jgi:CelD/BcsL family acetyltransferase involved in cellulose biosynthesis
MDIKILDPLTLSSGLIDRWAELQSANPGLASPYFSFHFIRAVASCRGGVSVAVINGGEAFFPFQREAWGFGVARPVGSPLSDYHGLVSTADFTVDLKALMGKCGLLGWQFNHVPACQTSFGGWSTKEDESPVIDLTTWTGGSSKLRDQAQNRLRKLEREVGPVEFDVDSRRIADLDQCMAWKEGQIERTGVYNIMSSRNGQWIKKLLPLLLNLRDDRFSAPISVLRAGGRTVAAHFGMRYASTLHYWFPAYDTDLRIYSPGTILLLNIADRAKELGVTHIDLGRGESFYKDRVATGAVPLLEGRVVVAPLAFKLLDARKHLAQFVRKSAGRS